MWSSSSPQHQEAEGRTTVGFHGTGHSDFTLKYRGLIRQHPLKIFRRELTELINYIIHIAPSFSFIKHTFMVFFRTLLYLGPCFCAGWTTIWRAGSHEQETVNILAILYQILPPSVDPSVVVYYLLGHAVVFTSFLVLLLASVRIFQHTAKLPTWVSIVEVFFFATIGQLFPAIGFNFSGDILGVLIWNTEAVNVIPTVILLLIVSVVTSIFVWCHLDIVSVTLYFRSDSLQALTHTPSTRIYLCSLLINAILSFASVAVQPVQIAALVIGILIYGFGITGPFLEGGFINRSTGALIIASGVTGAIVLFVHLISRAIDQPLELWAIFLFVGIWGAAYLIAQFALVRRAQAALTLLNRIDDDGNFFALLKTPNTWAYHACVGFAAAHEVCLDWRLFKQAIEFWPDSTLVWYAYAKFLAIYPSETEELNRIYKTVAGKQLHGKSIRCIKDAVV
jgi:hypothetical protein